MCTFDRQNAGRRVFRGIYIPSDNLVRSPKYRSARRSSLRDSSRNHIGQRADSDFSGRKRADYLFRKLRRGGRNRARIANRKDTGNEMESERTEGRGKERRSAPGLTGRNSSCNSRSRIVLGPRPVVVGTANLAGSFQERERRRERERLLSLVSGASCAPVALRLSSDTWHACRVPTTTCPGILSARGNFSAPPPPPRTRLRLQFVDMSSGYFFFTFFISCAFIH